MVRLGAEDKDGGSRDEEQLQGDKCNGGTCGDAEPVASDS